MSGGWCLMQCGACVVHVWYMCGTWYICGTCVVYFCILFFGFWMPQCWNVLCGISTNSLELIFSPTTTIVPSLLRIHIHDTKERVKFSLLGELLSRYPGGALYVPPELEQRTQLHLKTTTEEWNYCNEQVQALIDKTPVEHTDAYMLELASTLKQKHQTVASICGWVSHSMQYTLDDRDEWMRWREEVTFVAWQSMCTTVLSRKVKIEEDVDDGSFTTIDPLQLMGSVFKRLKIHENKPEQERCLAGIIEYCKSRIRDFKRIFQ